MRAINTGTLATPHDTSLRMRRHGEFFGAASNEQRTESFVYARMRATWSAEELPRHSHENGYFFVVLRGRYVTAASEDVCGPWTLIFNPPGTTHRDRFISETGQFVGISISPEISQRMRTVSRQPVVLRDPRLLAIARKAQSELLAPDTHSALVLEGLGLELSGCMARLAGWPDDRAPKWLLNARELLREQQELTIGEVARIAGVHRVHLARAFRRYFRCTPGAFVRGCRIEVACQLIGQSQHSMAEIAQLAGYPDQSQFARAFKRATGSSPSEWRQAHS
jgi:AraC family transcriptional regulator